VKYLANEFHRDACPRVYELYKEFLKTGQFPYLQRVEKWINEREKIADCESLHHEVYLSSVAYRKEEEREQSCVLRSKGYKPFDNAMQIVTEALALNKRIEIIRQGERVDVYKPYISEDIAYMMKLRASKKGFPAHQFERSYNLDWNTHYRYI